MRISRAAALALVATQLLALTGVGTRVVRASAVADVAAAQSRPALLVSSGRFGPSADDTYRLFAPNIAGRHPAVLFIHGGAWGRAQPEGPEYAFCRKLALRTGWVVATIGYPTWTVPERRVEPSAIRDALVHLAADPAVDPHRIALWGESSGGQLALLAAYRDKPDHVGLVDAVVSISGPTAMRVEYHSVAQTAIGAVTHFEGTTPAHGAARYDATSPVALVRRDAPPTFQAISRHDPLVPPVQVRTLSKRLAAAGVRHQTVHVPGRDHSFPLEFDRPAHHRHSVQWLAVHFVRSVFSA